MVLWCGSVGKLGLDLREALLMGLLLQGAWDAPAIPCASVGTPSAGMNGWGTRWGHWALSAWRQKQNFLTHWVLQGIFPGLGRKCQALFTFIPESVVCCCRNHIHALPGHILLLSKWTHQAKRDRAHPPPAGLGSSTAHESSLVLSTILQSKPNHETVLLLSDRVTSQKLCGGSTKSPVFSFAKLSQVIQSPERFFCQSEFAVIKLRCCEG